MDHRQAYSPRLWLPLNLLVLYRLGPLVMVVVNLALGYALAQARWWIWRHRHPVLSVEQYLTMRRRNAQWN